MSDYKTDLTKHNNTLNTYEDVLSTYKWILQCFGTVFTDISKLDILPTFAFTANEIAYECNSIDELKEDAFGLTIIPKAIHVSVSKKGKLVSTRLASVYVSKGFSHNGIDIIVSSENKIYISSLKDNLEKTSPNNKSKDSTQNKLHGDQKEPWYVKLLWKVVVPILVAVIAGIILWEVGINS